MTTHLTTAHNEPDGQHSVHADRRVFRDHAEEIAAALADRAECDCAPGWKHEPDCVHVTGQPRLRPAESLDEPRRTGRSY